jgi:hypothetical protein
MWVLDRDHLGTRVRPTHQSRKSMVAAFFGVHGIGLVKVRPECTKLTSEYFKDQVLQEIDHRSHTSWRLGRLTHLTLHYQNARVHNARTVSERFGDGGFIRRIHPPYSPDIAPCDFFVFRYLRQQLKQSATAHSIGSKMRSSERERSFRGRLYSILLRVGEDGWRYASRGTENILSKPFLNVQKD